MSRGGKGLDKGSAWEFTGLAGQSGDSAKDTKAAHPNARFTVSIYNSPTLSKEFDNPKGYRFQR